MAKTHLYQKPKATMVSAKPKIIKWDASAVFPPTVDEKVSESLSVKTVSTASDLPRLVPESYGQKAKDNDWQPVVANYPVLVYQTHKRMDDKSSPDMQSCNESKEKIEQYGFLKVFKQKNYYSHKEGYTISNEDQFSLSAEEHFKRMRGLETFFSRKGKTAHIFNEMVDKFELNQGGNYSSPPLNEALRNHASTDKFHQSLLRFMKKYLVKNKYQITPMLLAESSDYLTNSDDSVKLPKFEISSEDLMNGTVLAIHDIWSMQVYAENLEYKGGKIRGTFKYIVQDHFGLDSDDINNHYSFKENPFMLNPFELFRGFRSWHLLQHYTGYGYQPFFTDIEFTLDMTP
ncbi:DUF3289 family protein [Vibrio sp. PP-XX7]